MARPPKTVSRAKTVVLVALKGGTEQGYEVQHENVLKLLMLEH